MAQPPPRTAGPHIKVVVELDSWVTSLAEGPGTGALEFPLQLAPRATVREALKALSVRFPKLDQALWHEHNRQEIGPHLEVIVNNAILGIAHELETPLKDGDHIVLAGQYIGG